MTAATLRRGDEAWVHFKGRRHPAVARILAAPGIPNGAYLVEYPGRDRFAPALPTQVPADCLEEIAAWRAFPAGSRVTIAANGPLHFRGATVVRRGGPDDGPGDGLTGYDGIVVRLDHSSREMWFHTWQLATVVAEVAR